MIRTLMPLDIDHGDVTTDSKSSGTCVCELLTLPTRNLQSREIWLVEYLFAVLVFDANGVVPPARG